MGFVLTEVSIRYLKDVTGEKSYTLKHKTELVKSIDKSPFYSVLDEFLYLPDKVPIGEDAVASMDIYGLLNDAIILATCKFYRIEYLISFDSDFRKACGGEGIVLIKSKEKLGEIIGSGDSK